MRRKLKNMSKCKSSLGWLWLIGFGFMFFLLITQHVLGKFDYKTRVKLEGNKWEVKNESKAGEAREWFIPLTLPALSLIIGAWQIDFRRKRDVSKDRKVSHSIFRIFYSLSVLYLASMGLIILLSPFSRFSQIELMTQTKTWLLSIQGLIMTSLGAFFFVKKESLKKVLKINKKARRKK